MSAAQRYAALQSLLRSRFGVERDDVADLTAELADDVGPAHARVIARLIVDCGFSAEAICCVNGYGANGDPELYALALRGWPLTETRAMLERWAADCWQTEYTRDVCNAQGVSWP